MSALISTERLYLDAEKAVVVREGDPAAAFLLCAPGQKVPPEFEDAVIALDLDDPGEPDPDVETKEVAPPPNKQTPAPPNKGGRGS